MITHTLLSSFDAVDQRNEQADDEEHIEDDRQNPGDRKRIGALLVLVDRLQCTGDRWRCHLLNTHNGCRAFR